MDNREASRPLGLLSLIIAFIYITNANAAVCSEPSDDFLLTAPLLPESLALRPSIANGHLGTVIGSGIVHVNGIYNGNGSQSKRARIPTAFSVEIPGGKLIEVSLDLANGIFSEYFSISGGSVHLRTYAHRNISTLIVREVEVTSSSEVTVNLNVTEWGNSSDIQFTDGHTDLPGVKYKNGSINIPETETSGKTPVHVYYDVLPPKLNLPANIKSKTWTFLISIHPSPIRALSSYKMGVSLINNSMLLKQHCSAWNDVWKSGRVSIQGDLDLARTSNAAFFYLMSSLPMTEDPLWPYIGVSPTGIEVSPGAMEVVQEIHVSGDVSFAVMQLWKATHDDSLLDLDRFGGLLIGIADYWITRMVFNVTKNQFEVHYVQAPDEYHSGINNSAFTNAVAKVSLQNAAKVAKVLGMTSELYTYYAEHMYIPYDEQLKYHPEFDGYKPGSTIKQADVVLLGFPLMLNMSTEVRRNDLDMYSKVVSGEGPAMTWGMHTISWLEFNEEELAHQNFKKMQDHIYEPFKVWTEVSLAQGAPNFLTGIGGYLQSLIFGYGGLRLQEESLVVDPTLPRNCTALNLMDIDYLGNHIDIKVSSSLITISVQRVDPGGLHIQLKTAQHRYPLSIDKVISLPYRSRAEIIPDL
ncbi:hypothetical protein CAPTEDRAFT_226938 [Capitella teleta]|uniref:Glycoside hydrolase family 65 central catalytic domain-containing protein n=1 Tax=Capitella teleta TaxID=283909 RepID=R7U575_CAPTE|nr:hypothetical protein CAPTEDRAFT_226938 [Capitella teleta]|eukprot:ELT98821.1 hypothetical protein CAPTEDRAFT_226938 [Capitella teleta]